VAGAVGGGIAAGAAVAAAAAAVAALIWFLVVLVIAMRRARNAFYGAYAQQRELQWQHHSIVPAATPLLRRCDTRRADEAFSGHFPADSMASWRSTP
jgi:hypothetical protein